MSDFQATVPDLTDQAPPIPPPERYNPWKHPRTYISFGLGMGAVSMLFMCLSIAAVVVGWIALGLGIAAMMVARKEISLNPEAEHVPFIKWGKRTGLLGVIIGPTAAIIVLIILIAVEAF